MKVYLTFIFSMIVLFGLAQTEDGFDDGNFNASPSWFGDTVDFNVNADGRLQLNALSGGDSYLALPVLSNAQDSLEWKFKISLDFSPSSSNYCKIYLLSDNIDLTLPLNGYFLRFGEALSNDAIELFRQDGSIITSVCRATDGKISSAFDINVRILRTGGKDWTIMTDYSAGDNFIIESTGVDSAYTALGYFGIYCTYTSGNIDRFYFDDFYIGEIIRDTIHPVVSDIRTTSDSSLKLTYSEMMDNPSALNQLNYSVDGGIDHPAFIYRDSSDAKSYLLMFNGHFQSGAIYTLQFAGQTDQAGNLLANQNTQFTYTPIAVAGKGDIIFTEIYFEPSEASPLPYAEYVEIFNRKDSDIVLSGWTISDGSSDGLIPEIHLQPKQYVLLCDADDLQLFNTIPNAIAAEGFPSLNNEVGDDLKLLNSDGEIIDEVRFSNVFYHDTHKDDGGWSIEKKDCDFVCRNDNNWHASESSMHGSPGTENSVKSIFIDHQSPFAINAFISDSFYVTILMSEPVEDGADVLNNYSLLYPGGMITPMSISVSAEKDTVVLQFTEALSEGQYMVEISQTLKDCPGNNFNDEHKLRVGIPQPATAKDILINEVLYYCNDGATDYAEIYNASAKIIDLQNWIIAEADYDDSSYIHEEALITKGHKYIFPGEFLVLSEDESLVKNNYICEDRYAFLNITSMPDFNSDKGRVLLMDNDGNVIDAFRYSDDMQFPLLSETRGVALERLSIDQKNDLRDNWHSAAGTAGFGTPGYGNSQRLRLSAGDVFSVGGDVFSPDNDGYDDVLTVHYSFSQPGTVLSLNVYDYDGRLVTTIVSGETAAMEGNVVWDGLRNDRIVADEGIYILFARAIDINGKDEVYKRAIYLAKKNN